MARLFTALTTLFLIFIPYQASADDYDPGFGVYDPNRICHQAWCYMGKRDNEVGSIQSPFHPKGYLGAGLGMFVQDFRIDFAEMAFHNTGEYHVRLNVLTNDGTGNLRKKTVLEGRAAMTDHGLVIASKPAIVRALKKGRYARAYIFRNRKPYAAARFPLYGFTKAYSLMR